MSLPKSSFLPGITLAMLLHAASTVALTAKDWERRDTRTDAVLAAAHFADEQNGYAAGFNIVLRTVDGGLTWNPTPAIPTNATYLSVFAKSANDLFVGRTGLYRSLDAGEHWEEIEDYSQFSGSIFDIRFTSPSTGFFIKDGAVFRSTDGGSDWELIYTPGEHFLSEIDAPDALHIYAAGGITYGDFGFISRADFVRSLDGGETWESVPQPDLDEIHACAWVGPLHGIVFTFTGEVHETRDGGDSWDLLNPDIGAIALDAAFADAQNGFAVTLDGKILATTDGGETWIEEAAAEQALEALTPAGPQSFVAAGSGGTILQRLFAPKPPDVFDIARIDYDPEAGSVRLEIRSPAGQLCRVEGSPDLLNWIPLGEHTPRESAWEFFHEPGEASPSFYFRAVDLGGR